MTQRAAPAAGPEARPVLARRGLLLSAGSALSVLAAGWLAGCASIPRPDALITGRAFTRTRLVMPPDSVFEAVLLDVTDENAAPVALGRQRVEPAGQAPFDLAIPYLSSDLQRGNKYVVQAQVTLYGRVLLYSPGTHPVNQDPVFQRMDVILEPYPAGEATERAGMPLAQTHWRLVSVGEHSTTPIAASAEGAAAAYLQFHPPQQIAPDGQVQGAFSGSGGCNRFLGRYVVRGAELRLALSTTSIRLCLDGGGDEAAYLSALAQTAGFMQQGRELTLKDEDGKAFLRFRAWEKGVEAFEPYEPPNSPQ